MGLSNTDDMKENVGHRFEQPHNTLEKDTLRPKKKALMDF